MKTKLLILIIGLLSIGLVSNSFAAKQMVNKHGGIIAPDQTDKYELGARALSNKK